jgi:hypothetical protein
MYQHKYGEFADKQIDEIKEILRHRIFFLLLVAEDEAKNNKVEYPHIDLMKANTSLLWRISGLNELLGNPIELVTVLSLLEEAKNTIKDDNFNFKKYRKLILDAGEEIMKIASSNSESAKIAL